MPAPTRHSQQFRHRAEVASRNDTMKLSRAIVVVILMHVVAVGGVLAFSLLHEGKEEGGRKKEEVAKPARKTAPTQGIDAPKAAAPALPIPTFAKPAVAAVDPLESQALAILQGSSAPAKPIPAASPRTVASTAVPTKLTAKPDVRPASNPATRSPKKDDPKSRP